MRAALDPFSFVVISIAGWMNRHQQQVIDYLVEENMRFRESALRAHRRDFRLSRPRPPRGGVDEKDAMLAILHLSVAGATEDHSKRANLGCKDNEQMFGLTS